MAGTLASINTSNGGVPKLPRPEAHISTLGVEGDQQRDLRHHGGPDRAVCLYSLDVIHALQREGHSPSPGVLGENLTVSGIDWTAVAPGTVVEVGEVRLRITGYTVPCRNLSEWFDGENVARISQKLHPGWSRVYARVEQPGLVRVGDRVRVLPAADPGQPGKTPFDH